MLLFQYDFHSYCKYDNIFHHHHYHYHFEFVWHFFFSIYYLCVFLFYLLLLSSYISQSFPCIPLPTSPSSLPTHFSPQSLIFESMQHECAFHIWEFFLGSERRPYTPLLLPQPTKIRFFFSTRFECRLWYEYFIRYWCKIWIATSAYVMLLPKAMICCMECSYFSLI